MTTIMRAEPPIPRNLQEKITAAKAKQRNVKLKFWEEAAIITKEQWEELKLSIREQDK
jgi:hypothetical protein